MCNEYNEDKPRDLMRDEFSQLKIPFTWADAAPNRDLARPLKPTNRAPIIRPVDPTNPAAGLEGLDIRWWLIPADFQGAVKDAARDQIRTNAKVEFVDKTKAFREPYKTRRCLVPLTSFIEYDEPPGWEKGQPKRRWEIGWPGGGVRYFAGLWDRSFPTDMPEGLESFTFLTGPPNEDFGPRPDTGKPLHTRQARVLTLEEGMEWLRLDGAGHKPLIDPPPAGTFTLTEKPREAA